jgi:hypothetical protein
MNTRTLLLALLSLPALACSGLFADEEVPSEISDDGSSETEWDQDIDVEATKSGYVVTFRVVAEGAQSGTYTLFDGSREVWSAALEEGASGIWFAEFQEDEAESRDAYDYEIVMQFAEGEVVETGTTW